MATAQQFYSGLKGNGFPFCLPHVDTSDVGTDNESQIGYWNAIGMDWVFYGGSSVSYAEQIVAAVQFWWTLETFEEVGVLGTKPAAMNATQDDIPEPINHEVFALEVSMYKMYQRFDPPEPYERVCFDPSIFILLTGESVLFLTVEFRFGIDKLTGKIILLYNIDPDFSWGFGSPQTALDQGFTGADDSLDMDIGLITPIDVKYKNGDWSNGSIDLTPVFYTY
jgi:hypothetical protein